MSDVAAVPSGTPQGSILAPTLFSAFIDPLLVAFERKFPNLLLSAYADDLALVIPETSTKKLEIISQEAIDFVVSYINDLGLAFNEKKTQAVLFFLGTHQITLPKIFLNGHQLDFSATARYLGVTLSAKMNFSEHCHKTAKSGRQMLGAFHRKFGRYTAPATFQTVYTQCIRSKLEYGCAAWDPTSKECIEDLERTRKLAARMILNDWKITAKLALAQLEWSILEERRKHQKLLQLYRFYNGHHAYPSQRFIHIRTRPNPRLHFPHTLEIQGPKIESYRQSFEFSAFSMWNELKCDDIISMQYNNFREYIATTPFKLLYVL